MTYAALDDPYAYKGTRTLKNRLGLRDAATLESFELEMTAVRAREALPNGSFDAGHYRRLHHHLFQDVYTWAGEYRTVRIAKDGNAFCFPEHIAREMDKLFRATPRIVAAADAETFLQASARFLGELNAIHPFREGNGRTQLTLMSLLGARAGYRLNFQRVQRATFLPAMVASFGGHIEPLVAELRRLMDTPQADSAGLQPA